MDPDTKGQQGLQLCRGNRIRPAGNFLKHPFAVRVLSEQVAKFVFGIEMLPNGLTGFKSLLPRVHENDHLGPSHSLLNLLEQNLCLQQEPSSSLFLLDAYVALREGDRPKTGTKIEYA